jgi:hypothetical protein
MASHNEIKITIFGVLVFIITFSYIIGSLQKCQGVSSVKLFLPKYFDWLIIGNAINIAINIPNKFFHNFQNPVLLVPDFGHVG